MLPCPWGQQKMRSSGSTTQRENDSVAQIARPGAWLVWVSPAGDSAVPLAHGLVMGRDPGCAVRLDGNGVSRRHVEFQRQGPIFVLKDLSSTNGTFVNGQRVQFGPVTPGSVLRIGSHVGVFVECAGTPPSFRELSHGLFGGHELAAALEPMRAAATSSLPMVVLGPTGTGKERVARAIHEFSGRKGRFQALNCAALPAELAEAELFGYRKGAFTGAERASIGHFRAADGGTLFLDEILDLPLALQAKLLRVLEDGAVTPLGETEAVPIDVRIVAAAQHPLTEFVATKRFRDDLQARLAGLTITLPALRERVVDIARLFQHFVSHYSVGPSPALEPKLIECLCLHAWPGNVRELEQLTRRLLAVHGLEPILKRAFLPEQLRQLIPASGDSLLPAGPEFTERSDHDRHRLVVALKQAGGSVGVAAGQVGLSRQRAYRLLSGKSVAEWLKGESPTNGHVDANELR